jgi:Zn-dependent alcohol dehydrogenase
MSFFGSDSASSSSSSTSTQEQTISTVDNRVARDNAAVGGNVTTGPGDINGSLSISTTDQGAVKGGVDLALESIHASTSAQTRTQKTATDQVSQAYGLANSARQSETSGAINNFLRYGTWVAVAAIAAFIIVRYQKA